MSAITDLAGSVLLRCSSCFFSFWIRWFVWNDFVLSFMRVNWFVLYLQES